MDDREASAAFSADLRDRARRGRVTASFETETPAPAPETDVEVLRHAAGTRPHRQEPADMNTILQAAHRGF
jgi:hypothetical protein